MLRVSSQEIRLLRTAPVDREIQVHKVKRFWNKQIINREEKENQRILKSNKNVPQGTGRVMAKARVRGWPLSPRCAMRGP